MGRIPIEIPRHIPGTPLPQRRPQTLRGGALKSSRSSSAQKSSDGSYFKREKALFRAAAMVPAEKPCSSG